MGAVFICQYVTNGDKMFPLAGTSHLTTITVSHRSIEFHPQIKNVAEHQIKNVTEYILMYILGEFMNGRMVRIG